MEESDSKLIYFVNLYDFCLQIHCRKYKIFTYIPTLFLFSAYTDNELDVPYLMEEADAKAEAEGNNAELVDELGRYKEAYQELEQEAMVRF